MSQERFTTDIDTALADELVSIARTGLGDELRSVIYFTPSEFDILYVRQGIYHSHADARRAKSPLVDLESVGFVEAPVRSALSATDGNSELGPYSFTIRVHDDGFVVRKLVGDVGVLLTTDSMDITAFSDGATAIERHLSER
ncbi:DUF7522 family protein [Natronorubrum bangense]|uniref:Uncharacterized protein n=2 Tax=Natronorubrum bangense TaxID=61858 RepID=L9WNG7_9EURY|nr:hypothetical protein [Natronorubrum bangense]ELY50771.1 hypothetical protein C494_05350 [Natronorubrum bangense JCM 10635]QCC54340.1 hypothetical protein DV706_07460 [Natronorubrum bangense]